MIILGPNTRNKIEQLLKIAIQFLDFTTKLYSTAVRIRKFIPKINWFIDVALEWFHKM